MSSLSEYIKSVRSFIENNPGITEDLIIRYVYLDLGKRLSFNSDFIPFSNRKTRYEIYARSSSVVELEKCLENNVGICVSISKILEYVLKQLGINIRTIVDKDDRRKCPHVYNIIYPKNGRKPYSVDLQEDIYRIQMHGFTTCYGISTGYPITPVISRSEQEQMDRFLGYLDKDYYTDDYLYTLKMDMSCIDDFRDRVKFVLENIEAIDNPNMKYTDRQWFHVRVLESLFNKKEFNYISNTGKIRIVDCYKIIDDKKNFVNCITVNETSNNTDIYVYNPKEGGYRQISLENFAKAVNNGLVVYRGSVHGLGRVRKELKARKIDIEEK